MKLYKRVLIISNNTLSLTSNNGKTIWSLFEDYPKEKLNQLFTRDELPSLDINSYYRITNRDVLKGRLFKEQRGSCVNIVSSKEQEKVYRESTTAIRRTSLNCLIRELLWLGGWKSRKLDEWLNTIKPEIIFFVAGDTLYSYAICKYVADKTEAKINLYITDDYICKRSKENVFDIIKRRLIYKQLKGILVKTKAFFTISEKMRIEYMRRLGKDSMPIFNISERLCQRGFGVKEDNNTCIFIYTGSLYYGRDEILIEIANGLAELNKTNDIMARLKVFSNQNPDETIIKKLTVSGAAMYGGSLTKEKMVEELNKADVLLFVESFENEQIEKTRLSLSTKISEYLSIGKPILAVGPPDIGSMEFLNDVALCVNKSEELVNKLQTIILNTELRKIYGDLALEKYNKLGDFRLIRKKFIDTLCDG